MPSVQYKELSTVGKGESSASIRDRVLEARATQAHRFAGSRKLHCNADMGSREVQRHCRMTPEAQETMRMAMTELNFSARAYDRILKVARTIADLDHMEVIQPSHLSEAIQYRTLDRQLWV